MKKKILLFDQIKDIYHTLDNKNLKNRIIMFLKNKVEQ